VLVVLSIVLCVIVTAIGVLRIYLAHGKITKQNWIDLFKVGVSLAVSVIPEGYPSNRNETYSIV
jgi:magnesium-transporting ATPase (P-type)